MSAMMLMPKRAITAVTNPEGSLGTKARRTRAIAAMGCIPISTTRPHTAPPKAKPAIAAIRTGCHQLDYCQIIKIVRVTTTPTNIGR